MVSHPYDHLDDSACFAILANVFGNEADARCFMDQLDAVHDEPDAARLLSDWISDLTEDKRHPVPEAIIEATPKALKLTASQALEVAEKLRL